jgi:predicted P-loop ATPase
MPQAVPSACAPIADPTKPRGPRDLPWELTQGGALKPRSYINAAKALAELPIRCRHDVFHNRKLIDGDLNENLGPELSDAICRALRDEMIARHGVDFGLENVQQAAERACEANRFDPVLDYLDSLVWDGISRIDRWMTTYLGAEDTPLNRAIGCKLFLALVRRARKPGCKFDNVVVLEGPQGSGKSSALRILAGDDNFSDQPLLHLETRAQQEAIQGVWLHELSELAGLRRTEVETVKAFISKTADNSRPAYGRFRIDQPRRVVFAGTTNDSEYLKDATGNRRFWPVATGKIDLAALQRDRDQLFAEAAAAAAEKLGESLTIPATLYADAALQQAERMIQDPWEDVLAGVSGKVVGNEERISSRDLLSTHVQIPLERQTDVDRKRVANIMRKLGWNGPKKMGSSRILVGKNLGAKSQ